MSVAVGDVFALWPGWNRISGSLPMQNSVATVDDETEKVCVVLQAPKTGLIQYVGLGVGAVTHPTANIDVRLEAITTSTGNPTGTLFDTNTNWSGSFSSGTYDIIRFGPLTSNASVSQGDIFAIVYEPPANPDAGDVDFAGAQDAAYGFPYAKFYNGASWVTTNQTIAVCLWYTDGYVTIPSVPQMGKIGNRSWNNSDTYDHVGMEMKSNVACEVVGMWAWLDMNGNDTVFKLISGTDTVERSCTLEADYVSGAPANNLAYGYFSSPFTMQADTLYKFVGYTAENTDISLVAHNTSFTGDISSETDKQASNNWFYDMDFVEGELTTPAWREFAGAANYKALIGPIVRSIG